MDSVPSFISVRRKKKIQGLFVKKKDVVGKSSRMEIEVGSCRKLLEDVGSSRKLSKCLVFARLSQSKEISSGLCCFCGGGISHNEDALFSKVYCCLILNYPTPIEI